MVLYPGHPPNVHCNRIEIKKYFATGLIILLPVALTIAIVVFVFNLLTVPFVGAVRAFFERYHLFENGFLFFSADVFQNLVAQFLILISLILITIVLGIITQWFFVRIIVRSIEYIVKHIPLVSSIYNTCQDVINTIFASKTKSFKQVVIVHFPHPDAYAIGLVTRESIASLKVHLL